MTPLLVIGASGDVGRPLVQMLRAAGADVRAAGRTHEVRPVADQRGPGGIEPVVFDVTKPGTWSAAFTGVETMFVLRPPRVMDVDRQLLAMLSRARDAGVRHAVYLSAQGAGHPILPPQSRLPHSRIESWLRGSGLSWTFVRPSPLMQTFSTLHAAAIRDQDVIFVPAGGGRTAFVDAHDVAAVAVRSLLDPAGHARRAWTPTGPTAMTYDEVAAVLSSVLGRRIRYLRPGLVAYARHARRELHLPPATIAVTAAVHSAARLGLTAELTDDIRAATGQPPTDLREFAERERSAWERPAR